MDEQRTKLINQASELGVEFNKFWTTERIQLAVNKFIEAQELENQKADSNASDNAECPSNACQELQDQWDKTITCFSAQSKYCLACGKDFPETKAICEARSLQGAKKVKEKISRRKTTSGRVKVGFGHVEGTQAAAIDLCLQGAGMTKENIIKHLNESGLNNNNLDDATMWARVNRHFDDLRKMHSITITRNAEIKAYSGTA